MSGNYECHNCGHWHDFDWQAEVCCRSTGKRSPVHTETLACLLEELVRTIWEYSENEYTMNGVLVEDALGLAAALGTSGQEIEE